MGVAVSQRNFIYKNRQAKFADICSRKTLETGGGSSLSLEVKGLSSENKPELHYATELSAVMEMLCISTARPTREYWTREIWLV